MAGSVRYKGTWVEIPRSARPGCMMDGIPPFAVCGHVRVRDEYDENDIEDIEEFESAARGGFHALQALPLAGPALAPPPKQHGL
jgi:hypothetical protein